MNNIGSRMMGIENNGYALPFEVVSILLLAAMVGCIVIAIPASTKKITGDIEPLFVEQEESIK